jgi:hypothetical protein
MYFLFKTSHDSVSAFKLNKNNFIPIGTMDESFGKIILFIRIWGNT